MVHGLIKYYNLGLGAMRLRGPGEKFALSAEEFISTEDWNPLILAIGHRKKDVVQYFLGELKISLRQAGRRPGEEVYTSDEAATE